MKYVVILNVEVKEDDSAFPDPASLRARLRDVLDDVTKHDETIDWRVTNVSSVRQTLPDWMW